MRLRALDWGRQGTPFIQFVDDRFCLHGQPEEPPVEPELPA